MAKTDFLVSVVIPVYNAAKYLACAVESVRRLPEVGEIILVDDASADQSLALCFDLEKKDSRIKVLQHPDRKNHGVAATRNLGIKAALCDFIAFLDTDDYYLPNRFLKEKEMFLTHPEVDGVYGCNQAVFESESAREKFLALYKSEMTTVSNMLPPEDLFKALLFGGSGRFHTSAITLRKRVFERTGLFNTALQHGEDTELWLKLSLKVALVAGSIDDPISIRRVHDNNSIHQVDKVQYYSMQMYQHLFDWVMQQSFSFDVKNCFFICLHKWTKGNNYNVKRLFWEQVVRRPRLMLSAFFFKKIHQFYFI